jgi:hypothetical protein
LSKEYPRHIHSQAQGYSNSKPPFLIFILSCCICDITAMLKERDNALFRVYKGACDLKHELSLLSCGTLKESQF